MAELRFVGYEDEEDGSRTREAPLSGMLRPKEGQDKISIGKALQYGAATAAVPFQFAGKAMGAPAEPGYVPPEYLTRPIEEWDEGDATWFAG